MTVQTKVNLILHYDFNPSKNDIGLTYNEFGNKHTRYIIKHMKKFLKKHYKNSSINIEFMDHDFIVNPFKQK